MSERELQIIYRGWLAYKGIESKKRKHPSFDEFKDLMTFLEAYRLGLEEMSKTNNSGGADAGAGLDQPVNGEPV